MIIKNEEKFYFIDIIDNMKWNEVFKQFELLIKWEEYKKQTWKLYNMIKKNTSEDVKKFHANHSSQSVSTEWVKNSNKKLLSNT